MWGDIAIAFMIAFVISFMATPHTIKLAKKIGAVDTPKDERRINKVTMPRLGGLAVISGFAVSVVYLLIVMQIEDKVHFYADNLVYKLIGFFTGGLVICSVCFVDDCKGVPALVKLVAQIIAASIVVRSGLIIDTINLPFLIIDNGSDIFYIILTIGWIVGITNAMNLIDGLDGLASGISLIACVSLLIIFSLNGSPLISIILITALAGALLGFLPYNFNPAKTFIGDTGSNFLGYCLSIISILGIAKTYTAIVIIAPIMVLALPIFDTLSSIVRRLIHGKSLKAIIQPDAGHLHHRLLKKGFTQRQAVLILYFITATFGIFSIILMESGFWKAISFLGIIVIAVLLGYKEFFKQRLLSNPDEIKEDEKIEGQEEIEYIVKEDKVVNMNEYKANK
jgi:UDP-GlcNAc:undecaprenyl-phosphate GlcNAc-1-phosphate transferase